MQHSPSVSSMEILDSGIRILSVFVLLELNNICFMFRIFNKTVQHKTSLYKHKHTFLQVLVLGLIKTSVADYATPLRV